MAGLRDSDRFGAGGGNWCARRLVVFDPDSRESLWGAMYQYTSTESSVGTLFARTSFGADHIGLQFVLKPAQHMVANLEYSQGIEDNRGVYLKFGYGW